MENNHHNPEKHLARVAKEEAERTEEENREIYEKRMKSKENLFLNMKLLFKKWK